MASGITGDVLSCCGPLVGMVRFGNAESREGAFSTDGGREEFGLARLTELSTLDSVVAGSKVLRSNAPDVAFTVLVPFFRLPLSITVVAEFMKEGTDLGGDAAVVVEDAVESPITIFEGTSRGGSEGIECIVETGSSVWSGEAV